MATLLDVASRAGVSPASASRVLNGRTTVGADMRERVLAAARDLDFQPNRMAQGLRRGRGSSVALLVGDIEQNIYSALTKHVQSALDEIGLDLMLFNLDHSASRLRAILEQAPSMGLRAIALATTDRIELAKFKPLLQGLQQRGMTVLSVGQRLERAGIPSIVHEERAASQRAVEWLIKERRGPVAYVGRITGSAIGTERFRGYAAALKQHGLRQARGLVRDVSYRYQAGYDAMVDLLKSGVTFRALQAGSDEIALGVMAAMQDNGRSAPGDIAVIGFGNIDWGSHVRPSLTTISVDHGAVSAALCAALQADSEDRPVVPLVMISRELIRRQSA